MAVTGGDLGMQMRGHIFRPVIEYRECILRDVLPAFSNIDERAERIAEEYFAQKGNEPAGEHEDVDLGGLAEDARAEGTAFYDTMTSVRQTMLNLLAAGLFHLVEQQLAELCRDSVRFSTTPPPSETKLWTVKSWYADHYSLDLSMLGNWPIIDELRLLANTVKHAEIPQTERLRKLRPELFKSPASVELDAFLDDEEKAYANEHPAHGRVTILQPLAGSGIFVSESLIKDLFGCSRGFLRGDRFSFRRS